MIRRFFQYFERLGHGLPVLLLVLTVANAAAAASGSANVEAKRTLLVLGDSLSAEYGLPRNTGWVKLLADRLQANGAQYSVVNASISGETTSGGRARLPALLQQHQPAVVVIQLGGNDGLRGLPLSSMRDNLRNMAHLSRDSGARVLLVGMRIPPNYGRDYAEKFFATYSELGHSEKIAVAPFLLDGFADSAEWFQPDRIHPTQRAQPRMLDNVWPYLRPLLNRPAANATTKPQAGGGARVSAPSVNTSAVSMPNHR